MDPFDDSLGLKIPPQHAQAAVVTVSSGAAHHSATHVVTGERSPIVFSGPGEYEAAGLRLKGIRTARRAVDGAQAQDVSLRPAQDRAWNTVFVVEVEGMVLCHLGDLDRPLTERETEELASPHVLLLPVGSRNGLSVADAVELVTSVSPRIIVPMLFAHPGNRIDLRGIEPFLHELGAKEPEVQSRLTVTRATLPEETQVALLQPAATML